MYNRQFYVYMMSNPMGTVLYVGVTNELVRRVYEHKARKGGCFTSRYNVTTLVYYEVCNDIRVAIEREKQIKRRNRSWKIRLIEEQNPNWRDLYEDIRGFPPARE
ncbi:GIY-YIG nuclease family protein [Patescibacteria group bacterium]